METLTILAIVFLATVALMFTLSYFQFRNHKPANQDEDSANIKGLRNAYWWPVPGAAKWFDAHYRRFQDKPEKQSEE